MDLLLLWLFIVTAFTVTCIVVRFFRSFRFTKQRIVDALRLNRLFRMRRAEDYSIPELQEMILALLWREFDKTKSTKRNGWVIRELFPLGSEKWHRYFGVFLDNAPYRNVCGIMLDVSITGTVFKASVEGDTEKDLENMMNIAEMPILEIIKNLKSIRVKDAKVIKKVRDAYVIYALRAIL